MLGDYMSYVCTPLITQESRFPSRPTTPIFFAETLDSVRLPLKAQVGDLWAAMFSSQRSTLEVSLVIHRVPLTYYLRVFRNFNESISP